MIMDGPGRTECPHQTTAQAGTPWPLTWFSPLKPTRDPREGRVELCQPPINVYAGSHGHRAILVSVHNRSRSDGGRTHAHTTPDVDQTVTKIDFGLRNDPGLEY